MTSSLVGSEMCIRDSRIGFCRATGTWRATQAARFALGAGKLVPVTFGSVSYTHLTLPTICSV
eukprot:12814040-Prorocentrum_lima.AAC.1